jgi:hypothetical protein
VSAFGYTRYGQKFGAAVRAAGVRLSDYHLSATDRLAAELFELAGNVGFGGSNTGLENSYTFLYPFVGGTQVSHSFNLADPSRNRILNFGTVTHSANGITGPATVQLFPFEGPTVQDAECIWGVYQRSGVSDDQNDMFCYSGEAAHGIVCGRTTYRDMVFYTGAVNTQGYMAVANNNPQGFYTAMRYLQYANAYRNGVNVANLATGAAANPETWYLLYSGSSHNIAYAFLSRKFAVSGLPYAHEIHPAMYTIVQRFQATIGRAV